MSWGQDLWDKYSKASHHSQNGIDFLEHFVGDLMKERARVEADYAKGLRALTKRFMPKDVPGRTEKETFTYIIAYKQLLKEVGYQAGQHELLSESLSKVQLRSVQESVKRFREQHKRNVKEKEKISGELQQAYKALEAAKEKFRKSHEEKEKTLAAYAKANADDAMSRQDISKLQANSNKAAQVCDSLKDRLTSQVGRTNECQSKYYRELLPQTLLGLQLLEQERVETVKESLLRSVAKEKELQPIIGNCLEAAEVALQKVEAAEDIKIVIDRYKSGEIPPQEIVVDANMDPQTLISQSSAAATGRRRVRGAAAGQSSSPFQKKRELEKSIEKTEEELLKKQNELKALRKLEEATKGLKGLRKTEEATKGSPKPGDSKSITSEMQQLNSTIRALESALQVMRTSLASLEDRIQSRQQPQQQQQRGQNDGQGRSNSIQSVGQSAMRNIKKIASGSVRSVNESHLGEPNDFDDDDDDDYSDSWDDDDDNNVGNEDIYANVEQRRASTPPPPLLPRQNSLQPHPLTPPLPPQPARQSSSYLLPRCVALFPYPSQAGDVLQESNIPMAQGEEFVVVEADSGGWTRVRKVGGGNGNDGAEREGYVPTSFINMLDG